jgi:hypothetical protein
VKHNRKFRPIARHRLFDGSKADEPEAHGDRFACDDLDEITGCDLWNN